MAEPGKDPHTGEPGRNWTGAIAGWVAGGGVAGLVSGLIGGPLAAIAGSAAGGAAGAYYGYHSKNFPHVITRTAIYGLAYGTLREALIDELNRGTQASGLNPISRGGWNDRVMNQLHRQTEGVPIKRLRIHCDSCHRMVGRRWNDIMVPLSREVPMDFQRWTYFDQNYVRKAGLSDDSQKKFRGSIRPLHPSFSLAVRMLQSWKRWGPK